MGSTQTLGTIVPVYEELLNRNGRWALDQGGFHFQEQSDVQKTLRRFAHRLEELQIPYAIAGGMALFKHGFRRFTEDVDILVTRESLATIHARLEGLGYVPPFTGSKNLRDTEYGVRIEFLIAGEFPGDGKPKPVAFPDPAKVAVEIDGVCYVSLPSLVELKISSGMTGGLHRLKDLADIVELIKTVGLSAEFAEGLNPYVRDKYLELWHGIQESPTGPVEPWPS
jgi:hypothetical protein